MNQKHSKKQAIIVGIYMPHLPLGGAPDKVDYYRNKVMNNFHSVETEYPFEGSARRPCYKHLKDKEILRELRANYYAMIETKDELIGKVYDSYVDYLRNNHRKGIFVYVSDHGDQMGEKRYIGKRVFFEDAERIPLIIQIIDEYGNPALSKQFIDTPVSLMDVGPIICSLCKIPFFHILMDGI